MRARLFKDRKAKVDLTLIVVILIVILVFSGSIAIPKINLDWLFDDGKSGLVDVNKKLKFALTDVYAGSALTSKTIYVYTGTTLKESLTTGADGTVASAFPYESGSSVSVKYVDSDTKQWFHFTIPQMNPKDAESATYNNIPLEAFSVCTITDALRVGSTSINDAGTYNFTASGTTPQFTYDLFVSADNTGFIASQDPIYSMGWYAVVYMSLSGTNYETVLAYDFYTQFELGTTRWCAEAIPDTDITKYKVGNTYIHKGEGHFSYSLDGTGYTGTGTTMQLYLKIYSDPSWMQSHGGNFGPDNVELAEHTVTLQS